MAAPRWERRGVVRGNQRMSGRNASFSLALYPRSVYVFVGAAAAVVAAAVGYSITWRVAGTPAIYFLNPSVNHNDGGSFPPPTPRSIHLVFTILRPFFVFTTVYVIFLFLYFILYYYLIIISRIFVLFIL